VGASTSHSPMGLHGAVTGITLPLPLFQGILIDMTETCVKTEINSLKIITLINVSEYIIMFPEYFKLFNCWTP
jgi:hypothetical protein